MLLNIYLLELLLWRKNMQRSPLPETPTLAKPCMRKPSFARREILSPPWSGDENMAEIRHAQIPDRQTKRPDVRIRNHHFTSQKSRRDKFWLSDYTWSPVAYVLDFAWLTSFGQPECYCVFIALKLATKTRTLLLSMFCFMSRLTNV